MVELNPGFVNGYDIRYRDNVRDDDLRVLDDAIHCLHKSGIIVILTDVELNIKSQFKGFGIENKIGKENIFENIKDALGKAEKMGDGKTQNTWQQNLLRFSLHLISAINFSNILNHSGRVHSVSESKKFGACGQAEG
jgi:hypothetical protein